MEEAAWEMNRKRRLATTWQEGTVSWRRCKSCGAAKPLRSGFYKHYGATGNVVYIGICKVCRRVEIAAQAAAKMAVPEVAAARRRRDNARQRARRKANPEAAREARKRHYERVKADPALYAKLREDARMNYRLRRARAGLPVKPSGSLPKNVIRSPEGGPRLPAGPLALFVDSLVERRRDLARFTGDYSEATFGAVCRELGLSERSVRAWRKGERALVQRSLAESALDRAGVSLIEVYSLDDHPQMRAAREGVT